MSQLSVYDICKKISGQHQFWKCYVLGFFKNTVIVNGREPDILVRYHEKDKWSINRELVSDLQPMGSKYPGPEPGLQPERLTWFRTPQPPPVDPPPIIPPIDLPPIDPPPVVIPPVDPPEEQEMTIKMNIERKNGLPYIVMSWFEAGVQVELVAPDSSIINRTVTGAKGTEFGPNSCEVGYTRGDGEYRVRVGEYQFVVPVYGDKRFIKLSFETTGLPIEIMTRLASKPMAREAAELMLQRLDAIAPGMFKIEVLQ